MKPAPPSLSLDSAVRSRSRTRAAELGRSVCALAERDEVVWDNLGIAVDITSTRQYRIAKLLSMLVVRGSVRPRLNPKP